MASAERIEQPVIRLELTQAEADYLANLLAATSEDVDEAMGLDFEASTAIMRALEEAGAIVDWDGPSVQLAADSGYAIAN